MELEKIKKLALANGFSLKEQASGNMDLHSYVYEFANALLKEATPEDFALDAPARVGGGVFREGVKWKTVIESAQRLYEHSKDEIKPIVSPGDILKIASGELVLVPREPTQDMMIAALAVISTGIGKDHIDVEIIQCWKKMIEAQEQRHD